MKPKPIHFSVWSHKPQTNAATLITVYSLGNYCNDHLCSQWNDESRTCVSLGLLTQWVLVSPSPSSVWLCVCVCVCVCVPQECGCDRLHAGDGRVSVRRRRQAGDVSERVPGQRGLQQGGLLQSVRAGCGLHPQAAGQSSRVSRAGVSTVTWCM